MNNMDEEVQLSFAQLEHEDKQVQYEAYLKLLDFMQLEVDWVYEVWDELIDDLDHKDSHKRSRAAQFLAHLAKSDYEERIFDDFNKIWQVTYDSKFVTLRHSLQSIWRIGLAGKTQRKLVVTNLSNRFQACIDEKNDTLIRFDIISSMHHLYMETEDTKVKKEALDLIGGKRKV